MSNTLQLDKTSWKPVTFGDVVAEVRTNTKDPVADGIKRVVGLEHIEPECIHLRNWASIDEDTTFTKVFHKGHVLFGRRRAYLKKAALADFDGICSGDITVMEAKEDLLPELLPFLVNNDKFFDYAVQHSAGGLSPRTKFKDIANYEFLLPPKEQQAKLAELLWAADETIEQKTQIVDQIALTKEALIDHHVKEITRSGKVLTIAELATDEKNACCGGPFGSDLTAKDYVLEPGVPVIRGTNLTKGKARFVEDDFVYVSEDKGLSLEKNSARRGDILVTQRGTLGQIGLIPKDSKFPQYIVSQSQMKVTINEDLALSEYVYYYLLSRRAQRHLEIVTISTGVPHINLGIFKNFPIPVPSLDTQVQVTSGLSQIDSTIGTAVDNVIQSKSLLKTLINQIF
ncbi:hypothetical protein Rhal01_00241 [Rubritalea halochordaticola]|uniref:Type I restriction modification DNA specificity domain-containing protein n=1 Tax=Rubritalea halochordaticola TaxID=714537 RepID=A0ABP9UUL0_9BACT